MTHVVVSLQHNITPDGDITMDNIYEDEDDMNEEDEDMHEEIAPMENNTAWSDSEEECESSPITTLDVLNRFCLKIKEEALISTRAMNRIREVTISLLKSTAVQAKRQSCL